jgi:hypothetical protein
MATTFDKSKVDDESFEQRVQNRLAMYNRLSALVTKKHAQTKNWAGTTGYLEGMLKTALDYMPVEEANKFIEIFEQY